MGTPKNILIKLQVLCKTKWEDKNALSPKASSGGGRTDVKSVCAPKATGCERAVLYFHCRLEPFSENHNLFDLKRTSQNNFPSGICFFFSRNICLQVKSRDAL